MKFYSRKIDFLLLSRCRNQFLFLWNSLELSNLLLRVTRDSLIPFDKEVFLFRILLKVFEFLDDNLPEEREGKKRFSKLKIGRSRLIGPRHRGFTRSNNFVERLERIHLLRPL